MLVKNWRSLIVITGLVFLTGCFWSSKKDEKKLYLVNVLTKEFFDDCHIPGSLNISLMDLKKEAQKWPKSAKIVVYCSNYMCEASGHACKKLKKEGFDAVYDYDEGMAGWYQAHVQDAQAYPVVGPCQEKYLTMDNKKPNHTAESSEYIVITTPELKQLIDADKAE